MQPPVMAKKEQIKDLSSDEFWQLFDEIVADPVWKGWYQIELMKHFPELVEQILWENSNKGNK